MNENKIQSKILGILDEFVRICDKYNLLYFLAGGSALGAIRHEGFIPWDDDIDILMPRKDYNQLLSIPESAWKEPYQLSSFNTRSNYYYDFIKIEDKATTVIERLHPIYIGGLFIDIFPFDGVPDDTKLFEAQVYKIRKYMKKYIEVCIKHDNECANIIDLISLHCNRFFTNKKKLLLNWDKIASEYSSDRLVTDFHSTWMNEPLKLSVLGNGKYHRFAQKEYRIPLEHDDYLKKMYGDYLTPPPPEKRKGHGFYYVNTEKRLSRKELIPIINDIKKQVRYKTSIKHEIKSIISWVKQ